jgi:hypothetical protein
MPLQLLTEHETTANLTAGWTLVNQLEATSLPTRFGVTAQFVGAQSAGNMELSVEVLTTGNVSFGTHTVTAARVTTTGSPNHGRVEFDKLFYLPAGYKAKLKLKSLATSDDSVNTDVYVYDPNYPTASAEIRTSVGPTNTQTTYSTLGFAVGGQMNFSAGTNRGVVVGGRVLDKDKNVVPLELWLFRVSTTSGLADNEEFDPDDSQMANLVGVLRINDWFTADQNSIGQFANLPLPFADLTGGNLYGWLVNRGAPVYTSTAALVVELQILPG